MARQALAVRLASPREEDPTLSRGLALVHSLCGSMHVHRARDLGLLTAALRPDEAGERDAVDQVADAVAHVMGDKLRPVGNRSARFFRTPAPDPGVAEPARRELLRRFLRRCGPAVANDLAAWAGIMPPAASSWWGLLAGERVEVRVDGKRLWMHAEDLSAAREASTRASDHRGTVAAVVRVEQRAIRSGAMGMPSVVDVVFSD